MAKKQPNIVLIMSDDLGYEVIGANGGTSYATPRLDGMAESGMRFENAHVMPLCTPTRASLMTGKYNFRNYIGFGLLRPDEVTFGHLLSDAGYNTCLSGKWQLYSYNPPDQQPGMRSKGQRIEDAGFDEFCVWHAHHTEEKGSRYKNPIIYENGKFRDDTDGKYGEDIFCDYIIDYIERKKDDDAPFFVYWPMAATHKPHEPTPDSPEWEEFDPPANKSLGAKTWAELEDGSWEDDPRFYKDMVEYHDKVIGRLFDYLDEQGLREDTLVIYVGDNGSPTDVCSMMHEHNEVCGGKGKTNDRGTHVPLICDMPGTIPTNSVQTDLVESTDFLPTIFEAAGLEFPEGYVVDGRSFYPQLAGGTGNPRDWMFFHFEPMNARNDIGQIRFVRDREWNLYETGELYDLVDDLDEESPIYESEDTATQSAVRARLQPVFSQMR
ncbi:MAG: sulfatase-like hydrolase/transferase [SAR202 cluster bacterium]|jgi:arylsulfatase A-like enzyme|nr:sulfatase-like hydrolase/transferase [SAR202 cluster bacterium]MDP6302374.1 sulfatase-like hydrolase/transferase [SAR202 cluster bacterium]MDP7104708.1 sulfatase-like hydrolase/transferase [SAR202 cluster bacterium]MDP7226359.1 sulfatase-like hydrolase/transferase [SAR202 cluster bacterium]MDP7414315.1 sulfatase-like hydrolase/transferase [SAR202 cluster bacterium]|tara:strand:- start:110 stop:1420 length:1311 start_codon:yes stop_codon:yes gene_type:complete